MRQPRLKAPDDWTQAYYHCVSRVVDRRFVLGEEEKQQFIHFMRLYEKFCQVRVISYCLMSNHFHLLVEVPAKPEQPMSEGKLLEHIARCHGKRRSGMVAEEVRQYRAVGAHEAAQRVLESYLVRMHDLSQFMKTLKQRFTQWFNKKHERRGTLWEDRYRSTLVEGDANALSMVSSYIDLNPVRAGLVEDPKDYLWSSYGAAVAGVKLAIKGIETVVTYTDKVSPKGAKALGLYRVAMYGAADVGDEHTQQMKQEATKQHGVKYRRGMSHAAVEKERERAGRLSRWEMLRCRVRYFTAGAVIGSRSYVDAVFESQRNRFGATRQDGARPMKGADFGGLCALRDLRTEVIG
jgi:REP element-mobilizing transposase RayT